MEFKFLVKSIIRSFFIILTGINFAIALFTSIFNQGAVFSFSIFWFIPLLAFLMSLPSFIYYSKKELSRKNFMVRRIIHVIILIGILLTYGYLLDWINFTDPLQITVYLLTFIVIYVIVILFTLRMEKKAAKKLNESLKKYKEE